MTPETDAAERMAYSQEYMVPTEFARRLERERDEAREAFRLAEDDRIDMARQLESEKSCHAICQNERDEGREALREIEAADWKTSGELRGMAREALKSK